MARESKFGISYLFDFANITLRRKKRNSKRHSRPKTTTIYSSSSFSDSDWTFASYGSSETLSAYPVHDKPEIEGRGLYIRFASHASSNGGVPKPLSPTRATRLKYRIANAVLKAGMDAGSEERAPDPLDCALRQTGALPPVPVGSCYRGTYGQVMQAFESAGLIATPCDEAGFPNATRLGAMFVTNQSSRSAHLELMKVTLWA